MIDPASHARFSGSLNKATFETVATQLSFTSTQWYPCFIARRRALSRGIGVTSRRRLYRVYTSFSASRTIVKPRAPRVLKSGPTIESERIFIRSRTFRCSNVFWNKRDLSRDTGSGWTERKRRRASERERERCSLLESRLAIGASYIYPIVAGSFLATRKYNVHTHALRTLPLTKKEEEEFSRASSSPRFVRNENSIRKLFSNFFSSPTDFRNRPIFPPNFVETRSERDYRPAQLRPGLRQQQ